MLLVGTEAIPFRQRLRSRRRICPKSHHTSRHRAKARVTYRKSNRTATQTTPMKLLCSRGCATIGVARPRTRHFCRRETVEVQRIPITSEDAANTSDVEEQQRCYTIQGAFTGTQDQTGPPLTPAVKTRTARSIEEGLSLLSALPSQDIKIYVATKFSDEIVVNQVQHDVLRRCDQLAPTESCVHRSL